MKDEDCTSYIAILESEIESLKTKLNTPSIWEPRWKVYPSNQNRFDFMVADMKLAMAVKYPHEHKWQIHIDHGFGVHLLTTEHSLDDVKQYIISVIAKSYSL